MNKVKEVVDMNAYKKNKERVRSEAIEWQNNCINHSYSYGEFIEFQNYFESMGEKYGLLREFRENGII